MHAATARSDLVVMNVAPSATGGDRITVDILLMVPDVVVVYLDIDTFTRQADADMTALGEEVVVDVNVTTLDIQPKQIVTRIVAALDFGNPTVKVIVMDVSVLSRAQELNWVGAFQMDIGTDAEDLGRFSPPAAFNSSTIRFRFRALDDAPIADNRFSLIVYPDTAHLFSRIVPKNNGVTVEVKGYVRSGDYEPSAIGNYILRQDVSSASLIERFPI